MQMLSNETDSSQCKIACIALNAKTKVMSCLRILAATFSFLLAERKTILKNALLIFEDPFIRVLSARANPTNAKHYNESCKNNSLIMIILDETVKIYYKKKTSEHREICISGNMLSFKKKNSNRIMSSFYLSYTLPRAGRMK